MSHSPGPSWVAELKSKPVADVAAALGLLAGRWIRPCPGCGATQRSDSDSRRGPIDYRDDGKRWYCHPCTRSGSSVDLAAWALINREPRSASDWTDLREALTARGLADPSKIRPAPTTKAKPRPPASEVQELWARCSPATASGFVSVWHASRGLDASMSPARALPAHPLPRWARAWDKGWLALLPAYDATGAVVSLRARWALETPRPDGRPKTYSMEGPAGGLVLACDDGARMLRGEYTPSTVIVTEGEPDFLTWATRAVPGAAVLGIWSGSWDEAVTARIPGGARVILRTHNDKAGHGYAAAISASLARRQIRVVRALPPGPGDDNDALQRGELPDDPAAGALPEPTPDTNRPPDEEDDSPPPEAYEAATPGVGPEAHVVDMLQTTKKGPKANGYNLGTILRNDSRWALRLRYNEFRDEDEIRGAAGWRPLDDVDDINLCRWMSLHYRLDYTSNAAREQVMAAGRTNSVHPVLEYLDPLVHDGVPRLSTFLEDCFGIELTEANIAVGRAWLISMVARVRRPGVKVDTVPIFIGKQGTRKSSTLRAMMANPDWFSDSHIDLGSKDMYQLLRGKWLIEVGEFDQFSNKTDANKIKAYVTGQVDTYRASYGRRTRDVARQTVFAGTTNAMEFIVDPTGSRRFWLLECGDCDPDAMASMRDQLWAEACVAYAAGERWYLSSGLDAAMAAVADGYRVSDPWEPVVRDWLAQRIVAVTTTEVLTGPIGARIIDADRSGQMRVAAILALLGWRKKKGHKGPTQWLPPGVQDAG